MRTVLLREGNYCLLSFVPVQATNTPQKFQRKLCLRGVVPRFLSVPAERFPTPDQRSK